MERMRSARDAHDEGTPASRVGEKAIRWEGIVATAAAIALGLGILWAIQLLAWPLALLIGGIAIAAALAPVVGRLANYMPRTLAVLLVYLLLLLILVGLGAIALPPIVTQGQQVLDNAPEMVSQVQQRINQWIPLDNTSLLDLLMSGLQSMSGSVVSFPQRIARTGFHLLVIVFISIYLLILAPLAARFLLSLVPEGSDAEFKLDQVLTNMAEAMGGYIRGVAIDSVLVGILTYIGLLIIGLDYALVLAVISGLLEIIPVIGPVLAGAAMVGVAIVQAPSLVLIVLIFAIVLQQIESNIIVPNIMRGQAEVSPVLTILALIAGERIGGIIGALIAIPLAAALRVFVVEVLAPVIRRRTGAWRPTRSASGEGQEERQKGE